MGADFYCSTLMWKPDAFLNWDAAIDAAKLFSTDDLEGTGYDPEYGPFVDPDKGPKSILEAIINDIKELRKAVEIGYRDCDWRFTPDNNWKILITGGMSWGDSPTDTCSVISRLETTTLLDLIGFS